MCLRMHVTRNSAILNALLNATQLVGRAVPKPPVNNQDNTYSSLGQVLIVIYINSCRANVTPI